MTRISHDPAQAPEEQQPSTPPDEHGMDRRRFLRGTAGVAASMAAAGIPLAAAAATSAAPTAEPQGGQGQPQRDGPAPEYLAGRPDPTTVPAETWMEPWSWRPEDWPDDSLVLNIVGNQNPGPSPSRGNPGSTLFSYGGTSPGPTIRVRADGSVRITLRNHLGLNKALRPVGPMPDPIGLPGRTREEICRRAAGMGADTTKTVPPCNPIATVEETEAMVPARRLPGYALNFHVNGPHSAHTTNLHTHGIHTSPGRNADGTWSDDVLLRVIPRADAEARRQMPDPIGLGPHEVVGQANVRIDLNTVWARGPANATAHHPPGTHWYHPHAHGSANDQVASGMAGFLIVEGDVDEAINTAMTGEARPDPTLCTGPFDYRERLVFLQRVFLGSLDMDAGPERSRNRVPPFPAVNGLATPTVMFMRPGAVERWRVLNGSVDGKGSKRFMVLEGEFVETPGEVWRVIRTPPAPGDGPGGGAGGGGGGGGGGGRGGQAGIRYERVTRSDIQAAKLPLHLLARDGVTLVTVENGVARHTIKDLSTVNAGTTSPLDAPGEPGEHEFRTWLRNLEGCYRDGASLRLAFNRPNEVYLTNANRADLFFKAPLDSAGKVFTIFAQEDFLHQDNTQQGLQQGVARLTRGEELADPGFRGIRPLDVVVGYIHVRGEPVGGGDFPIMSLRDHLPPVPPYLTPVSDEELRITASEAPRVGRGRSGQFRSRVIAYSGWGAADYPLIFVPEEYAAAHPELKGLTWDVSNGLRVLLPPDLRTMAIHGDFDLAARPDPGPGQKFSAEDPNRPVILAETAEEWAVCNLSMPLWAHTDADRFPNPAGFNLQRESYPLQRAEGQRRFWEDHSFQIRAKGNDHPFHIHVNPCWVTRLDVPDENGVLHNILPEPVWMDTIQIPRAGGRAVFRSRFTDFTGMWVHHCHILAHEDNGMMQLVECTEDASRVNYRPRDRVASFGASAADVDATYPRPSLDLAYRMNIGFEDRSPMGYNFPGFAVPVPTLED